MAKLDLLNMLKYRMQQPVDDFTLGSLNSYGGQNMPPMYVDPQQQLYLDALAGYTNNQPMPEFVQLAQNDTNMTDKERRQAELLDKIDKRAEEQLERYRQGLPLQQWESTPEEKKALNDRALKRGFTQEQLDEIHREVESYPEAEPPVQKRQSPPAKKRKYTPEEIKALEEEFFNLPEEPPTWNRNPRLPAPKKKVQT